MIRPLKGSQRKVASKAPPDPSIEVAISPPFTAEDHIIIALNKVGPAGVVRILRDWCGSKEIRGALDHLPHRDPVDRFKHATRHAVEIFAKANKITPACLMVKITGVNGRKAPENSERYKLQKAREYLKGDPDALIGAKALARYWRETRPKNMTPDTYLIKIKPKV